MPYRPAQIWTGSAWDDIGDARVGVQPINTRTADYTLVLGDIATRVQMNSTSARTITIPPNSSVAFPVGTRLDIANINTGVLTIAGGAGVTVNGRALTLGQWETATVVQRAANAWVVEPQANLTDALGSKLDLAGGKILQIVRATDSTRRTTTSTSFVDASISVTITPQKSDSAILLVWIANLQPTSAGQPTEMVTQIADASNNAVSGAQGNFFGASGANGTNAISTVSLWGYATPATTSAVTYKGRFRASTGGGVTAALENTLATGQFYAIEVSA